MSDFDVVVVGSGAGGGIAALEFARKGFSVLVVERGRLYPPGWTGRDHLRNHRYSEYGHNTGPELDGNPRVFRDATGAAHFVKPHQRGFNNNAMGVGGGSLVYGAQAWRFHPNDFKMASQYGIPSGSSLQDWPLDYQELNPFYEEIEQELGVCGGPPAANMPHRRDLPMPALPISARGERLSTAAKRLGWAHQSVPLLINSVERNGRGACRRCQHCVGFGCPTNAKAGTQNTAIPQLLAYAGCELWTEARALRLLINGSGRVKGVRVSQNGINHEVKSDMVVLSAGAIESARLLLLSRTPQEPNGVGNDRDLVGRNLQGHYYPGAQALFDEAINDMLGPGPSVSVTQFNHGNRGIVGGGMMADDFIVLPIAFARDRRRPGVPNHGPRFKEWVREGYLKSCHIFGPVQDIPNPNSRITLEESVVDDLGLPVARLSGTTHPETVITASFMKDRAAEWLSAAGATKIWKSAVTLRMSAGQHQAGTCRMAASPSEGVVDSHGRVFGHDNLLICDGSVHVTNGGFNPVLTIMATSLRTARKFCQSPH